jgi:7-cyano-7-deazaguanine synthase
MPNTRPRHTSTLVLFCASQDSSPCLAQALARYLLVKTLGFDCGRRHDAEPQARISVLNRLRERFPAWGERLYADHLLDHAVLGQLSDTPLTRDATHQMQASGLPNTTVPGRNLLLITFAAALAYRRDIDVTVTGVCETEFSGYPDSRRDTLKAGRSRSCSAWTTAS